MAIALLSKFKVSFSVECISWYWVRRSDWKENKNKKNQKKSRNRRPWYPRTTLKVNIHIFGLTNAQFTVKNVHVFVPVFLYAVTMLIFQIKRIISSEKWFNYVVTLFLKMSKIWVGQTTLNAEKKEDGLSSNHNCLARQIQYFCASA